MSDRHPSGPSGPDARQILEPHAALCGMQVPTVNYLWACRLPAS